MPLGALIRGERVVVCVGSGGVGKTTVAAAVALRAAAEGRKVLVCTIDPARRLANSLGLAELGNVETRVPAERLAAAGARGTGQLFAMMLDPKRTFDDLVHRHVTDPQRRDAILRNHFYLQLSTSLAGAQEYMAMEKLYELREARDYDLVVLDTPPTTQALDFLDAPNRVLDVLGNDAARWLLAPALKASATGLALVNLGSGYIVRTISKFTGLETLQAMAGLLLALSGMYDGFKERATRVKELLASRETAFLLVAAPSARAVNEAVHFHAVLSRHHMRVAAAVANRVHPDFCLGRPTPTESELADLAQALRAEPPAGARPLAERLGQTLADAAALARTDRSEVERLRRASAGTPVMEVPRFDTDVYDLVGLWRFARHLVPDGEVGDSPGQKGA